MPENILFTSIPEEFRCYLLQSDTNSVSPDYKKADLASEEREKLTDCIQSQRVNKKKNSKISKNINNESYEIVYDYDDLDRINSRTIYKNNKRVFCQKYYFDILDRIVEYQDDFIQIHVSRISENNKLISYKIIDYIGNELSIENIFFEGLYKNTTINLNGHIGFTNQKEFIDNKLLERPQSTQEDFDSCISVLFNKKINVTRPCEHFQPTVELNISLKHLPISIRKLSLITH